MLLYGLRRSLTLHAVSLEGSIAFILQRKTRMRVNGRRQVEDHGVKMSVTKLPAATLNLKQFLQRQKVLGLYRTMLRTIRQVPDEADRKYLRDWAREEFKRNKEATNEDAIRMMMTQAKNHLEELRRSLALAKS